MFVTSLVALVLSGAEVSGQVQIDTVMDGGVGQSVLSLSCPAAQPVLGWSCSHWYFASTFDADAGLEDYGAAYGSCGGNEIDQASAVVKLNEHEFAGARVFPVIDTISCTDNGPSPATYSEKKFIRGSEVWFAPKVSFLGGQAADGTSVSLDQWPAGQDVNACFLLDAHPRGADQVFIQIDAAGQNRHQLGTTFREANGKDGATVCEMVHLNPGSFSVFATFQSTTGSLSSALLIGHAVAAPDAGVDPTDAGSDGSTTQKGGCSATGVLSAWPLLSLLALARRRRT